MEEPEPEAIQPSVVEEISTSDVPVAPGKEDDVEHVLLSSLGGRYQSNVAAWLLRNRAVKATGCVTSVSYSVVVYTRKPLCGG